MSDQDLQSLRYKIRHSAAHVMADVVTRIFPETKLAIGPPTEDGFYYDFMTEIQEIKGTNHVIKKDIMIHAEDPIVREVQFRHYHGIEEYTEKQTKAARVFHKTNFNRAEISLNFLKELIADARKRHNLLATTQPNPLDAPDKVYCEVSK